jgi:hypothetical protein
LAVLWELLSLRPEGRCVRRSRASMVMAVQRDSKGVLVRKDRPVVLWLSVLDQIHLLVYVNLFTLLHFGYPAIFHLLLLTILPLSFPTGFFKWFIEGSVELLFYVYSYCRCCRSQVYVGVSEVQTSHRQPSAAQPPTLCTACIRTVRSTVLFT